MDTHTSSLVKALAPYAVALATLAVPQAILPPPALSQIPTADTLVIGTRVAAPFVMVEEGEYAGLSVALWNHVADEMELPFVFEERDLEGLLTGVQDGSLYASVAALTVTAEREERLDFTHPFFTAGLGIAVPHRPAGFVQSMLRLFSLDFLWAFGLLGGLLLLWGGLVWIFERVENPEDFGGTAAEGIGSGFWWAAVTMTTVGYGDKAPKTLGGRVVGFVWMFTAIIVISFFTAAISSSLTVTQLDSRVTGPEDLPQARVGTLAESAAASYLADDGISSVSFPGIPDGLEAVASGSIDAFVHDAPILRYLGRNEFRGRTRVLPQTFAEQYYAIALPTGAADRDAINLVLLEFLASEEWAELRRSHLGDD